MGEKGWWVEVVDETSVLGSFRLGASKLLLFFLFEPESV